VKIESRWTANSTGDDVSGTAEFMLHAGVTFTIALPSYEEYEYLSRVLASEYREGRKAAISDAYDALDKIQDTTR